MANSGGGRELRGFLYRTDEGKTLLADKPNLRSCCVQKEEPIELIGFPPDLNTTRAILVRGELSPDGKSLLHAEPVIEKGEFTLLLCSAALLLGATLFYLLLRRKILKRSRSPV